MSSTLCAPCPEFQCICNIPECATLLNLGQIPNVNTSVFVQIEKQNGAQFIQAFTSLADGTVRLDLSDPDTNFFNHFDGLYMVWVTLGGYLCENDKLEMTASGTISTMYGFAFEKAVGSSVGEVFATPQN